MYELNLRPDRYSEQYNNPILNERSTEGSFNEL